MTLLSIYQLNVSSFLFGISSLSAMIIAVIELVFSFRLAATSHKPIIKRKCSAIRCTRIFDDLTASFFLSAKNCLHSLKIWHTPSFGYTFAHKNDFFIFSITQIHEKFGIFLSVFVRRQEYKRRICTCT